MQPASDFPRACVDGAHRGHGQASAIAVLLACIAAWAGAAPADAAPAPVDRLPRGVLDADAAGFLPGRFVPVPLVSGGRDTFAWQSPAFASPFEFFLDEVVGVRFGPAPEAVAAGPWRLVFQDGDALVGTLEAVDAETVTFGVAGRQVRVKRAFIEQLGRTGRPARGAVSRLGWKQDPPGAWREDAGGWSTNRRGASLLLDVDDAGRLLYDIVLTWQKSPAFRIAPVAIGRSDAEPYRVELFAPAAEAPIDSLLVVREEGRRAAIKTAFDVLPEAVRAGMPAGRLRLLLFVDQARGRLAVSLPETGDDAAVIDLSLPPDAGRGVARRFQLVSGGDVRLESLRVSRWTDEDAAAPRRRGTTIDGAAGPLAVGELESLDAAAGEFVIRGQDGPRRVPIADATQILFPLAARPLARTVPDGPPVVRVSGLHEQLVHGRLLKIDEEAVWLKHDACGEPLAMPHASLIAIAGAHRAEKPRPLPTRVGMLRQDGLEMRGGLVAGPGGLAWQPLGSRTASSFVGRRGGGPDGVVEYVPRGLAAEGDDEQNEDDVGGMGGFVNTDGDGHWIVSRLAPDGAAARDGRIEVGDRVVAVAPEQGSEFVTVEGLEHEDVMNLLRGQVGTQLRVRVIDGEGMNPREVDLVRGRLGIRNAEFLKQALDTHARLAPADGDVSAEIAGFPARLFLRSGDVIPCSVAGIVPEGIRIRTAAAADAGPLLVPAANVTAVELMPRAARRKIEAARRDRLLTLPRSQRFDPPTHIVRLDDGDYLRGQIVSLDEKHLVITVPLGQEKRIPRARVARVIWLHPEELTGDAKPATGARGAGTRAQGVAANGTRVTLAVDGMQEGRIRGRIPALGPGVIDVGEVDRVLLGEAIDREAVSLRYRQWKLKPAPEPLALRGQRHEDPAVARPRARIPVSELAGNPAPRMPLPRIDGKGNNRGRTALKAEPGRILVLEFWSEWSEPSRETLPTIMAVVRGQPPGVVDVVAVNVGDQPAKAAAPLDVLGLDTTALDTDRSVASGFGVRDVPSRAIVGPDGLVVDVLRGDGPQAVEEFRSLLAATVAQAAPLREELGRLNEVRTLAERGDRQCLDKIVPLLASTNDIVRQESVSLLQRIVPLGAMPAPSGPARLTADVRLDREVAAWKRWIAREGTVAQLRPLPTRRGDGGEKPPAKEVGRFLVCMPAVNAVGEFSPDGQKVWHRVFKQPGACQGLPNGHRLVGSAAVPGMVVEFDADGKQTWNLPDLPAGVTSLARLADGNTLVGFGSTQRVAEYDPQGMKVWEAAVVGSPCAVFRLEEGTTLVACQESDRIVEIDRDGRELKVFGNLHGLQGAALLTNGNVLATMTDRVVELDARGEVVWSKEGFDAAVGADRLTDGRTLVLESQRNVIVEVDAAGQERGRRQLRGKTAMTRLDAY